jgi:hypothetical protein
MAPGDDAAVHRQLGELVAGMHSLQESIKRVEDQSRRSEDKATESRAAVHRRMDDMVSRVGSVEQTVSSLKDDVLEMKPVTEDVKRWRLMGLGALGMIGIGGIALGVTFADAMKRIASLLLGRI